MKKILILLLILISSCSSNMVKNDFIFSNDMNFDDFQVMLEEYSKNKSYPNIDN